MKRPAEMSDSELAEAVARECLAWIPDECDGWALEHRSGWICDTCGETGEWTEQPHTRRMPDSVSDPRDAERVLFWMVDRSERTAALKAMQQVLETRSWRPVSEAALEVKRAGD